jgi:hypothetical protein
LLDHDVRPRIEHVFEDIVVESNWVLDDPWLEGSAWPDPPVFDEVPPPPPPPAPSFAEAEPSGWSALE